MCPLSEKKSTEQEYCSSKDNTLETTAAKNAETCVVLSQDHLDVPLCFWEHVLRAVEKKVVFFYYSKEKWPCTSIPKPQPNWEEWL